MLKKISAVVAAVAAALALSVAAASPSSAAEVAALEIGTVGYNAPGADTWANRNREYVDVTNVSGAAVDVKGLIVEDAWSHQRGDDNIRGCNRWVVNTLPGVVIPDIGPDAGKLLLPAGHTVRVYAGGGFPRVFGTGGRIHAVFMAHRCGYQGHFLGNTNDSVWITLGADSESKSWDFSNGFYLR